MKLSYRRYDTLFYLIKQMQSIFYEDVYSKVSYRRKKHSKNSRFNVNLYYIKYFNSVTSNYYYIGTLNNKPKMMQDNAILISIKNDI